MPPLRLTRRQSREVDRIAINEYGIPGIVLMENAARGAADAMSDLLPDAALVAIVAGPGNNGGDGFALARHLCVRGNRVTVLVSCEPKFFKGDAAINLNILQAMKAAVRIMQLPRTGFPIRFVDFDCIVDALFGTGLNRAPGDDVKPMIEAVNGRERDAAVPVVSLDLPSGLDCDTGRPLGACIRATRTVTFGAGKAGFANPAAAAWTGEVVVVNIGAPPQIIERAAASPA